MTAALALNDVKEPLSALLERQRAAFTHEGTVTYETRINRLDRCITLLVDHQQEICNAVNEDFGSRSHHVTLVTDIFTSVNSLKFAKKHLRKWMKSEKRGVPVPLNLFGAKATVNYQPKGVIGIMTPWNVPINMIFGPLCDAFAAGNRVMIKPSEFTPKTAKVMAKLFETYFENTEVTVVTGGADVGGAFSSLHFDHLIFTGATSIGKLVMRSAAENLTPVTLELGGKSPVVVSDSIPIKQAAEKIITGKCMNSGQICISPDYVFVPAKQLEAFITHCDETINKQFPTLLNNPDVVSLINRRHFERIQSYLTDAREKGAKIIELNPNGDLWATEQRLNPTNKIPLHLIINPTDDMLCMQDEIFGPILNIKTYRKIDDCIKYINNKPRPLALYYFGKNTIEQAHVLENTTSGGVSINDVAMHFACDDIPFGGIGPSGMGSYHGHEGFKTFSHAKSVFKQGFVNLAKVAGLLPPYTNKVDKIMALQIKK